MEKKVSTGHSRGTWNPGTFCRKTPVTTEFVLMLTIVVGQFSGAGECGSVFNETDQHYGKIILRESSVYQPNCTWYVEVADDRNVTLIAIEDIPMNSSGCEVEHMNVYKVGPDNERSLIQTLCGTVPRSYIETLSSHIVLEYRRTGTSSMNVGDYIEYIADDGSHECGYETLGGTEGHFGLQQHSYDIGVEFQKNGICTWNITATEGSVIRLAFEQLSLGSSNYTADSQLQDDDCEKSYLTLYDSGQVLYNISACAVQNTARYSWTSSTNSLVVQLTLGHPGGFTHAVFTANYTVQTGDIDLCATAACSHSCTETDGGKSFVCLCDDGYVLSADDVTCKDRDECTEGSAVCSRGRVCANTDPGYECVCAPGYIDIRGICLRNCSTGEFIERENNYDCASCPIGTYQNAVRQYECKNCPPGSTTQTTGSDSLGNCEAAPGVTNTASMKLQYVLRVLCTSAEEEAVSTTIHARIVSLDSDWSGLCTDSTCSNVHVTSTCESPTSKVIKSVISLDDVPTVLTSNATGVSMTTQDVLITSSLLSNAFDLQPPLDATLQKNEVVVSVEWSCEPGYQRARDTCELPAREDSTTSPNTGNTGLSPALIGSIIGGVVGLIAVVLLVVLVVMMLRNKQQGTPDYSKGESKETEHAYATLGAGMEMKPPGIHSLGDPRDDVSEDYNVVADEDMYTSQVQPKPDLPDRTGCAPLKTSASAPANLSDSRRPSRSSYLSMKGAPVGWGPEVSEDDCQQNWNPTMRPPSDPLHGERRDSCGDYLDPPSRLGSYLKPVIREDRTLATHREDAGMSQKAAPFSKHSTPESTSSTASPTYLNAAFVKDEAPSPHHTTQQSTFDNPAFAKYMSRVGKHFQNSYPGHTHLPTAD